MHHDRRARRTLCEESGASSILDTRGCEEIASLVWVGPSSPRRRFRLVPASRGDEGSCAWVHEFSSPSVLTVSILVERTGVPYMRGVEIRATILGKRDES